MSPLPAGRAMAIPMIALAWLAVALGGVSLGAWYWRRARSAACAFVLWLCYAGYEYLMHVRVLCSGECNIRVDLLLIYPFLLAVSLVALWRTAARVRMPDPQA